jgi:hypothetical protein
MGSPVACDLVFNIRKTYQRYSEAHSGWTFPPVYHSIAGLCKAIQELRDKNKSPRSSSGTGATPPVSVSNFRLDLFLCLFYLGL